MCRQTTDRDPRRRDGWVWLVLAGAVLLAGCAAEPIMKNPLVVTDDDFENVWDRTVNVVDDYFGITREDRRSGLIVTQRIMAAQMLEPWRGDSVTLYDRIEATMRTIGRRAEVRVARREQGGHTVEVKVFKEQEARDEPLHASYSGVGNAGFVSPFTIPASQVPPPSINYGTPPGQGWHLLGRDGPLENRILYKLSRVIP